MSLRATRAVAAVLSVPVLLAGAACSQDASAETVTSVLDTGDTGDALTLPPAPRVGQTASGSLTMELDVAISASGQDVEVDMRFVGDLTTDVVDVNDDGGYTLRSTFHDVTVESSEPAVVREMERAIPDGLTYEETYDESGQRVSSEVVDAGLTDAERDAVEEFVSQAESATLYAPGAPVGLGAAWTATTTLASGGGTLQMAVRNELSSLTDSDYVVDMTIDSAVDTEIDGEHLTGSIGGGGQLSGSRDNPLVMAGDMVIDLQMSGGGMSMTMDLIIGYDFTDQPAG
jgi:hypothetical protein